MSSIGVHERRLRDKVRLEDVDGAAESWGETTISTTTVELEAVPAMYIWLHDIGEVTLFWRLVEIDNSFDSSQGGIPSSRLAVWASLSSSTALDLARKARSSLRCSTDPLEAARVEPCHGPLWML